MGKLKLLQKFFMMNVRMSFEYRINALVGLVAIGLTDVASVLFFWVIFSKIPTLAGWTLGQLLFLSGTASLVFGVQHAFLSGASGWNIEHLVRQGSMDRIILRPLSTIPHLLMSNCFDFDGFGDVIAGLIIIAAASNMLGVSWTIMNILLYILFILSATIIVASIHLMIGTICFWVTRTGALIDLFYTTLRFADYPLDIFNPVTRFILTVIVPIGFISYYPSQVFLDRGLWMTGAYLTPVVAVVMYFIAKSFWDFGLKHYTSTGN